MKTQLKLGVALATAALMCACASDGGGTQRGDVTPHPSSSSDTRTGNCVRLSCCTSEVSCNAAGQLSAPAAPEFRFAVEVRGRPMPEEFRVSENLIGEKVVPEPVKISDYAAEGMTKGVSVGAQMGAGVGIVLARIFPPAIVLTPVLLAGGAVVGAFAGPVAGAGVGAAKHGLSVSRAHRSEREAAYSALTEFVVAGAKKELEFQDLLSPSLRNAVDVGNTQKSFLKYTVWIKPRSIRTKETAENDAHEQAAPLNQIDVEIDVQATSSTDQRIVWQTQFRATFAISGALRTASEDAMNRAGKEIAALTLKGLDGAQSRGTFSTATVFSSSGAVVSGTGRPLLHTSVGSK